MPDLATPRRMALALFLALAPTPALAAVDAAGGYLHGTLGLTGQGTGQPLDLGYRLGLGGLLGSHEPKLGAASLVGLGVELRQDLLGPAVHTGVLASATRSVEFLGGSYGYGLQAGPEWAEGERGTALLGTTSLKLLLGALDPHSAVHAQARLEGGAAAFGGQWTPRYGLTLGLEWRLLGRI
jgi:hypothetical protein